jgi:hypothetical protein
MNDRLNTCYKRFDLDLHFKVILRPKPVKTANCLKNLLLQNRKCQRWTKSSFIISMSPFSSLFEATYCDWYFSDYECAKVFQITISMLKNFFTIEQNIVLTGYRQSYPRNLVMLSVLLLTYISRSNQGHNAYFRLNVSVAYIFCDYKAHLWSF